MNEKQIEKNIELRSEKVRNIVGQIPPALLRYGTIVILIIITLLISIIGLMPYKKIALGTCTIYDIQSSNVNDSIMLYVELDFIEDYNFQVEENSNIRLLSPQIEINGKIVDYVMLKTSSGINRSVIKATYKGEQDITNSQMEFVLTISDKNILSKLLNRER